jgi:hypothetical protein
MADKRLDIPPGIKTAVSVAVETAVRQALAGINLVDLQSCQDELRATREALLDMQQNFMVWQQLAKLRGDENERLKAQIEQMNAELISLRAEIVLLRSALENKQ